MSEQNRIRSFICPFCFAECKEDEVLFRATDYIRTPAGSLGRRRAGSTGGLLSQTMEDVNPSGNGGNETDELFRPYDTPDPSDWERIGEYAMNGAPEGKKLDIPLMQYWSKRGGADGYIHNDPNWFLPHIDPRSATFRSMIITDPRGAGRYAANIDENGFVRERGGFITRVVDRLGGPDIPMKRLCPYCHNPFPLTDYGKYPILVVAIVGMTGSGKTVYLNQLFSKFSNGLEKTGYKLGATNLEEIGKEITPDSPLPSSTDDSIMRRPMAASLIKDSGEGLTMVFYDIAGENCQIDPSLSPDQQALKSERLGTISTFIEHCDGMIFLLDPRQIPELSPTRFGKVVNVKLIVDEMKNIRGLNAQSPDFSDVPVAITVAQSDTFQDKKDTTVPEMFTGTNFSNGFDREDFIKIDNALRVGALSSSSFSPLSSFPDKGFFAVSAITCGVESRFMKFQNEYVLDPDNESSYKRMLEWIIGWNSRTPEEREHFASCPVEVFTPDGERYEFDYQEDITVEKMGNLILDISGYCEAANDEIQFTLADVISNQLVGYAIDDPDPRRVADPVRWILWKKRKIGPRFVISEPKPKKGPLERQWKYDARVAEYEERQAMLEKEFYYETEGGADT